MTQEEFKEQFLNYAEYNLHNDTILQAVIELLNRIGNELYENGYTKESNRITTCEMIIEEVLERGV